MVRISRKNIIEEETIHLDAKIGMIKFNEAFILSTFTDQESSIQFLAKIKLIKNRMLCDNCGNAQEMSPQKTQHKCNEFMWCCNPGCLPFKSIRYGSF
jgi:hypothetical protein